MQTLLPIGPCVRYLPEREDPSHRLFRFTGTYTAHQRTTKYIKYENSPLSAADPADGEEQDGLSTLHYDKNFDRRQSHYRLLSENAFVEFWGRVGQMGLTDD